MNKKKLAVIGAAAAVAAGLAAAVGLIMSGNSGAQNIALRLYMYNSRKGEFVNKTAHIASADTPETTIGNALNALAEYSGDLGAEPLDAKVLSVDTEGSEVHIDFDSGYISENSYRNVAVTYCVIKTVSGLFEVYDELSEVLVTAAGEPVKDETGQVIGALSGKDINIMTGESVFETGKK